MRAIRAVASDYFFFRFRRFCRDHIISGVDVDFFDISFDLILSRRHLDVKRNIMILGDIMDHGNLDSYILESRYLESSIIGSSLSIDISDGSVVFCRSSNVLRLLILEVDFEMLSGKLRFDSILLVNIGSWNEFFLHSYVFLELSREEFWFFFDVLFLPVFDVKSDSFSLDYWLNYGLLVNVGTGNLNRFFDDVSFLLNSSENGLQFSFFNIRLIDVNFLVNSVFLGLNVGVIFNNISRNLNGFLYLFVCLFWS